MTAKFIHNPRCSKSRQALALLQEKNIDLDICEYLKTPLSKAELDEIFIKLKRSPEEVIRVKEDIYKELNLKDSTLNRDQWLEIIEKNPRLLERPIFINGNQAVIGRPPELVLTIISL